MNQAAFFRRAYYGGLVADALAMPGHWYYNPAQLLADYGPFTDFKKPRNPHPGSILWRSTYEPVNEKGDILHDQAQYWGQVEIHYHQFLQAGENTINLKLARALYRHIIEAETYDKEDWLKYYVHCMTTPHWHNDTYLEEYHRGFFTHYAQGKKLLKCGIRDEHIGGLALVPALIAAYAEMKEAKDEPLERAELRAVVRDHVTLTHRHSNVLRAADCLTRLLWSLSEEVPLREALMSDAGDWFSTKKAQGWSSQPDTTVIGQRYSPACYIDQAFPSSIYLSWKYFMDYGKGIQANAEVGGDSCHRGVVIGALLAGQDGFQDYLDKYTALQV